MKNLNNPPRRILLIEPNYKNKFPPIGLMKIATYHKRLGDFVRFYKGNLRVFSLEETVHECISKLEYIENSIRWIQHFNLICLFIQKKEPSILKLIEVKNSKKSALIESTLVYYRQFFLKKRFKSEPQWDRVYVTSLFTFNWKITIETINYAKIFVKNLKELKVGGILASLLPEEIEKATGIKPIKGLLDTPHKLDKSNDLIVDQLPLDYSILYEIDYQYPLDNTYFTYMTRGCKNKCEFCAVPKLEPNFRCYIPPLKNYTHIQEVYGDKKNLILMDNNVLASKDFQQIINDIKNMGFTKGAKYKEPNQLDISIQNLKDGQNDFAFTRRCYSLLSELKDRLKGKNAQNYYNILVEYNLLSLNQTTKENLLEAYPLVKPIYQKFQAHRHGLKFVDFNQGVDCRRITPENMKLMGQIPINPLRIAFDDLKFEKKYRRAIELAEKNGIKKFSNYLLFNYKDHPDDLYRRLEINMELCEKLDVSIYSFPMKYIPIKGESAKNREYTGKHWNKKFIGAIQSIINVTKGIVAPPNKNDLKRSFFVKAFGRDLSEYHDLLYMPDTYIVYRKLFEKDLRLTEEWEKIFKSTTKSQRKDLVETITGKSFSPQTQLNDPLLNDLLCHYKIKRDFIKKYKNDTERLKYRLNKKIFNQFAN